MPPGPFETLNDFITNRLVAVIESSPAWMLYAVVDKTQPTSSPTNDPDGALAGIMGYLDSSAQNLSTEIGFVVTLPPFQRTHVTSNAVGLLLQYALDSPEDGGLGLRRVQWQAHDANEASKKTAEGMGFKFEGVHRWQRVFRDGVRRGKVGNGRGTPKGAKEGDIGRDTVTHAMCWDDWEDYGREQVRKVMERK
ncbi:MAG: hypothetical protein Q9220_002850 [cf. Caloplaca sp. 1 TL-2023]